MKKLLVASLLSLVAVTNAFALFGCGCKKERACETTVAPIEAAPRCSKQVEVQKPAHKVCETQCHWECPDGYTEA